METEPSAFIVPLDAAARVGGSRVGGKAEALGRLIASGLSVPPGFCLTLSAYERFITDAGLVQLLQMELGRKALEQMRWEEMWDAALRIRSAFLSAAIPVSIAESIRGALTQLKPGATLAVRSSALGEDSANRSFAGLHESVVGVTDEDSLFRAIRVVWSSLWSDAALLYRRELGLDPLQSRMAVVVQEVVTGRPSGVAFGRDPRDQTIDREIVEAVPGPCSDLVDGVVDPDRWLLNKSSGEIVEWRSGEREEAVPSGPLLLQEDLTTLHRMLGQVEALFGWAPDVEWTGHGVGVSVLQARPITSGLSPTDSDDRRWYLTLRPRIGKLRGLARRVSVELIPELRILGECLSGQDLEVLADLDLADSLEERRDVLAHWRKVYHDDFIPLAHGVRYLAAYYNDAVRPADPYEFVALVQGQDFLASRRNKALENLAAVIQGNPSLHDGLRAFFDEGRFSAPGSWADLGKRLSEIPGGDSFLESIQCLLHDHMDTTFDGQRLTEHPDGLISILLQLSDVSSSSREAIEANRGKEMEPRLRETAEAVEHRLLNAVGDARAQEAREVIELGRLSWRLRDDDNLLLGRLESQLLRAVNEADRRVREAGRLKGAPSGERSVSQLCEALRDKTLQIVISDPQPESNARHNGGGQRPRQMVGQPASPGCATGSARVVGALDDLGRFRLGEILVCDAIQPTMTHLIPLAAGIIERRGGMLIHGAIIARELAIPCVNGIADATSLIQNGECVTVDGYLGIVTVGPPEFDLESVPEAANQETGQYPSPQ